MKKIDNDTKFFITMLFLMIIFIIIMLSPIWLQLFFNIYEWE